MRERHGRGKGEARKARINSSPAPMHLRPHLASRWSQKCIRRRDAPAGRRSPRYLRFSDLGNRRMLFLVVFFSLELSFSAYARSAVRKKKKRERERKGRKHLSSQWTLDFVDLHSNDLSRNKLTSVFTRSIIKKLSNEYFQRRISSPNLIAILLNHLGVFFFFRETRTFFVCFQIGVFVPTLWIFRRCKTLAKYPILFREVSLRRGKVPMFTLLRAAREDFEYFRGEKKAFSILFLLLFTRSLPALAFRESLPTFVFFVIHFCFARSEDRWQDWTVAESILVRSLGRTQLEATQTVLDARLIS